MSPAAEERSQEERNVALWITALIFRNAEGKINPEDVKGEGGVANALRLRAASLLGHIDSSDMGQGAFSLRIPKTAISSGGFHEKTWSDAQAAGLLRPVLHGNPPRDCYEVDYQTAVTEFLPRLEAVAGTTWEQVRELREQHKPADEIRR